MTKKSCQRKVIAISGLTALAASLVACSPSDSGSDQSGAGDTVYTLSVATAAVEGTPNRAPQDMFFSMVEEATDGRVQFDVYAPEALCAAPEIIQCAIDGRADVGVSVPEYTPDVLPMMSVVSIPFENGDSQAVMEALWEANTTDPGAVAYWDQVGLVQMGHWPVGRLLLGSKEPIESVADLDGKAVRATGQLIQQSLATAGANIVAVTASEVYESAERGMIDIAGFAIDGPVNYKLLEVFPYWSDTGIGHYGTFGIWFNEGAFNALPEDLAKTILEVADEFNRGPAVEALSEVVVDDVCPAFIGSPQLGEAIVWDESDTEEWHVLVGEVDQDWIETASGQGLEGPEGFLETYRRAYDSVSNSMADPTIECLAG